MYELVVATRFIVHNHKHTGRGKFQRIRISESQSSVECGTIAGEREEWVTPINPSRGDTRKGRDNVVMINEQSCISLGVVSTL